MPVPGRATFVSDSPTPSSSTSTHRATTTTGPSSGGDSASARIGERPGTRPKRHRPRSNRRRRRARRAPRAPTSSRVRTRRHVERPRWDRPRVTGAARLSPSPIWSSTSNRRVRSVRISRKLRSRSSSSAIGRVQRQRLEVDLERHVADERREQKVRAHLVLVVGERLAQLRGAVRRGGRRACRRRDRWRRAWRRSSRRRRARPAGCRTDRRAARRGTGTRAVGPRSARRCPASS